MCQNRALWLKLDVLKEFIKQYNIYILKFYWSLVDLQCCIHFCCRAKWFSIRSFPYCLPWWFMIDVEQGSLHWTVGPCLSVLCVIRTQSTFDPLKSYKDCSRQDLLFCSILYCSIPFCQHYLKTYYVPTPVSVYLCFYHLLNDTALREADESGQVALTAAPVSPCHPPALIPHGGQAPQNPALPICPHFPASVCLHLCFPRQIATTRQLALGCSITSFILTILLIGIEMKTDLFQSCGHCWVFQICWHIEFSTFTASSFRIWNSSAGIVAPPLALFVVMLPKAHLTEHSRMSDSRWVITPSWLSGSLRSFLTSYSIYSCHLFLISSASVRSILFLSFIVPIFAWNVPLVSLIFLKQSLVFPILLLPEDVQTTAQLHSSHTLAK